MTTCRRKNSSPRKVTQTRPGKKRAPARVIDRLTELKGKYNAAMAIKVL